MDRPQVGRDRALVRLDGSNIGRVRREVLLVGGGRVGRGRVGRGGRRGAALRRRREGGAREVREREVELLRQLRLGRRLRQEDLRVRVRAQRRLEGRRVRHDRHGGRLLVVHRRLVLLLLLLRVVLLEVLGARGEGRRGSGGGGDSGGGGGGQRRGEAVLRGRLGALMVVRLRLVHVDRLRDHVAETRKAMALLRRDGAELRAHGATLGVLDAALAQVTFYITAHTQD